MRIFYEVTHTACDHEIMKTPGSYDAYHSIGGWDTTCRPIPEGVKMVKAPEGIYDVAVVGSKHGLSMVPQGTPTVWKCLADFGNWPRPTDILDRIYAWVAPCSETVKRWSMEGHPKARVIEHGINPDLFIGYRGGGKSVMTVGNFLPTRPEKGPDVLLEVAKAVPVNIIGYGNDKMKSDGLNVMGLAKDQGELAEFYRSHRVYFNPSTVVVCAVLEAMATGMPVVTMDPGNFIDLMRHRENCFIAKDTKEAVYYINLMLKNKSLASSVGSAARESVKYRFHPGMAVSKWGALMRNHP